MFVVLDVQLGVVGFVVQDGLLRIVPATIVHDDDLFFDAMPELHCPHFVQNAVDGGSLVIGWDDDGELGDDVC